MGNSYGIPDCFMTAFMLGLIFGLLYEALRIIRLIFKMKAVTFICDIAFFVLAGAAVFKLSLALGNHIRIYTLLGFGSGVFAYIATVGRIMNTIESAAAVCWRKTLGRFFGFVGKNIKKLFMGISHKITENLSKIHKNPDNNIKKRSKLLKRTSKMLYNIENGSAENEGSGNSHVIKAKVRRTS